MIAANYFRQGAKCIILSMFIVLNSCDDDNHKVTQIVADDLESGNQWDFHSVESADHKGLLENTVFASSSHSLAITSALAESDGFSFWRYSWTPTDIPLGSALELKVKVKVTDVTGNGAYFALRGDNNSSNVFFRTTQGIQPITGNKEFQTYTLKLDAYPEGVTIMYIFLILDGTSTGSVFFDDILLESHH